MNLQEAIAYRQDLQAEINAAQEAMLLTKEEYRAVKQRAIEFNQVWGQAIATYELSQRVLTKAGAKVHEAEGDVVIPMAEASN